MRLTSGSTSTRARLRLAAVAGVTVVAIASGESPVLGSDQAGQVGQFGHVGQVEQVSTVHPSRVTRLSQGSNAWHAARAVTGLTNARKTQWRSAVSPSPYLSRAQVDAMSPRQVVDATLGDVVRRAGHAGRVQSTDRSPGSERTSAHGTKHGSHHGTTHGNAHRNPHHRLHFGITTFNALGSQHTAPGGDAVSYAPGRIRTQWMADYLSAIGSSVVGMQEIQTDQVANLNLTTGGQFSFWPASALGGAGVPQTMMWKTSIWKPKALDYVVVPFMGGTRPQPVVLLKNRKSKRKIYVLNIHNSPKDAKGRQGERNRAVAIEQRAVRTLRSSGYPVFIVGDFNEHEKAFCGMTDRTGLKAANGGAHPRKGRCRPPGNMRVDWIFGSRDAEMSKYLMDQGPIIQRITDHAVITTKVTVH